MSLLPEGQPTWFQFFTAVILMMFIIVTATLIAIALLT